MTCCFPSRWGTAHQKRECVKGGEGASVLIRLFSCLASTSALHAVSQTQLALHHSQAVMHTNEIGLKLVGF